MAVASIRMRFSLSSAVPSEYDAQLRPEVHQVAIQRMVRRFDRDPTKLLISPMVVGDVGWALRQLEVLFGQSDRAVVRQVRSPCIVQAS